MTEQRPGNTRPCGIGYSILPIPAPALSGMVCEMGDAIHRILSGQSLTPRELTGAGIFVLVWFGMDVIMFIDFIVSKLP